jgi:hypothetical protein
MVVLANSCDQFVANSAQFAPTSANEGQSYFVDISEDGLMAKNLQRSVFLLLKLARLPVPPLGHECELTPNRVGVTPEMLTSAQTGSHVHRSIFILPATAPFVNAIRMQALGNADVTGGAAIPSAIAGPRTLDAAGLAEKIWFSIFILPSIQSYSGPGPLAGKLMT